MFFALECILAGERNALRLDDASRQGVWSAKKCVLDAGGQSFAYGQPSPADGGFSLAAERLPNAPHDRLLNACFTLECILAGERNALRLNDASRQGVWSAKKCVLDAGGQSSAYGQPSPADGGSCRWAVLSARCGLRLLQTSLMAGLCFFPCVSLPGSVK